MRRRIYFLAIAAIWAMSALLFGCHGDNSLPAEIDEGDDGVIEEGEVSQEIGIGLSNASSRSISFSFPEAVPEASLAKAGGIEFTQAEFEAGVSVKDAQGKEIQIVNWIWAPDGKSAKAFGFPYKALLTVEVQGQSAQVQMPANPMDFDGDGTADFLIHDPASLYSYALLGTQVMALTERPYDIVLGAFPMDFGDVWEFNAETVKNRGFILLGDLDGDGIASAALMDTKNALTYFWHGYASIEPDESLAVYGTISDPPSSVADINGDGGVDMVVRDAQVNESGEVILSPDGEPIPAYYLISGVTAIGNGKYPWEIADNSLEFDLTDFAGQCGAAIGNFDGDVRESDGVSYPLGDIAACLAFVDDSKNRWEEILIVYGEEDLAVIDQIYSIVNNSEMALRSMAAGDFDGDGIADFASVLADVISNVNADVMILFNEKGAREELNLVGSSELLVSYDVNPKNVEVAVPGDVNGDGRDDLIVTSVTADGLPVATLFSWNDAAGALLPLLDFIASDGQIRAYSSKVGDMNNDGFDELPLRVTPGFSPEYIAIIKGSEAIGGSIDLKKDANALHVRIFYSTK